MQPHGETYRLQRVSVTTDSRALVLLAPLISPNPFIYYLSRHSPLYEELHFSSLGADWPSLVDEMDHPDESSSNATRGGTPARGNRNPLRFLASRLRRRS